MYSSVPFNKARWQIKEGKMFATKMTGKDLKDFAKFLETVDIDYLKDKDALEQLETLYKAFIYQKFCNQKIKEAI